MLVIFPLNFRVELRIGSLSMLTFIFSLLNEVWDKFNIEQSTRKEVCFCTRLLFS